MESMNQWKIYIKCDYISGFLTSKGELVRAILYPKPVDFKFNKDTYIFVCVLATISCIGLVYTVISKVCSKFSVLVNAKHISYFAQLIWKAGKGEQMCHSVAEQRDVQNCF